MALRMALLCHFILGLFIISSSHAWVFIWHGTDNNAHVESGSTGHSCQQINMDEGKLFSWDPKQTQGYCINLFSDDNCADRIGWSCSVWGPQKLAHPRVKSTLVNKQGDELPKPSSKNTEKSTPTHRNGSEKDLSTTSNKPTSTGSSMESTTTASSTMSESTTLPASEVTGAPTTHMPSGIPTETGKDKCLPKHIHMPTPISGGVIAGAVIASLAGVGALAFFGFFVYRLRKARAENAHHPSPDVYSSRPPKQGFTELDSLPASPVVGRQYQGPPTALPAIHPDSRYVEPTRYENARPPMSQTDISKFWDI